MTETDEDGDIAAQADRLYAARTAIVETARISRGFGVAELVRFLSDLRRQLSMDEQRALFADPQLRSDYRRLKAQLAIVELPALAAASVGDVKTRRFEGGTASIHRSRVAGQAYVIIRFSWPAGPPRILLLESPTGEILKRELPVADANGELMLVMDEKSAVDGAFLRLISDPTSTGTFFL